MNIILPKTLTATDIISNNLNDNTTAVYSPTTDYVYSDTSTTIVRVDKLEDETTDALPVKLYELLGDSDVGTYPPDNPTLWSDNGPITKDAMFDTYINTASVADGTETTDAGKIVIEINASLQTSVALFGLQATDITFELFDSTGAVLEDAVTYDLIDTGTVTDYYGYFFDEFAYEESLTHSFYISHASTMKITIEDNEENRYPECGYVILGRYLDVGKTQFGISSSITDFSTQQENAFGELYLKQGNYADTMDVDIKVSKGQFGTVKRALTAIRSTPTVFNANNDSTDESTFILLAKYDSFDLIYEAANYYSLNLNLRGLI